MSTGNPQDPLAARVQAPARLTAVHALRLLDAPAAEAFDALTRLADSDPQRHVTLPAAKLLADTVDTMGPVSVRAGLAIRLPRAVH